MGNIFQVAAIENIIPEYIKPLANKVIDSDPEGEKYRWPLKFQDILQFPELQTKEGKKIARIGFIPILLYASLSTRSWAKDKSDNLGYIPNRTFLKTAERWAIIINYLSEHPNIRIFNPFNFNAVWDKVNNLAKLLFGRTIVEEIEVDIEFHEKELIQNPKIESQNDQDMLDILTDHIKLRKDLYKILKKSPQHILDPDEYVKQTLHKVRPIPVLTFPSGVKSEVLTKSKWKGLSSAIVNDGGLITQYHWTATPKNWNFKDKIGFEKPEAWENLFKFLTPLAKAMLKGRNHRTCTGPDFIIMEQTLKNEGIKVIYEPEFEFPQNLRLPADVYYKMRVIDSNEALCDFCGKLLYKPDGYILSPWLFRKGENGKKILSLSNNNHNEIDWSPWLCCNSCCQLLENINFI